MKDIARASKRLLFAGTFWRGYCISRVLVLSGKGDIIYLTSVSLELSISERVRDDSIFRYFVVPFFRLRTSGFSRVLLTCDCHIIMDIVRRFVIYNIR